MLKAAWDIGNASKIRDGEDPWIGCCGNLRLSAPYLLRWHDQDVHNLQDVPSWIQEWKPAIFLGLDRLIADEWDQYVLLLEHSAIKLKKSRRWTQMI